MVSIKELEEKKQYLTAMRPFTKDETTQLINKFIIGNTTNIQCADDAYSETEKMLCISEEWSLENKTIPRRPLYYFYEIQGIISIYNHIFGVIRDEKTGYYRWNLSEDELKWINHLVLEHYTCLLPYEKGAYRKGNNDSIGIKLLPSREVFEKRLIELIHWYNKTDLNLFKKLSEFHMRFECDIHPFYDGNGRTGRALLNLELARNGYPMINLKYNNLEQYELAFDEYDRNRDMTIMNNLILKEVDDELLTQIRIKSNI